MNYSEAAHIQQLVADAKTIVILQADNPAKMVHEFLAALSASDTHS